ncbi:GH25 family lysozyme [Intestinimonas sp.]|uniref:GH25 family lysozyme n=1 Tax=Intestinimonas sp. TaxID=1965293 RepID=UPI00260C7406|nr:GH25 family lysozyme [Intestinimonas sp.]
MVIFVKFLLRTLRFFFRLAVLLAALVLLAYGGYRFCRWRGWVLFPQEADPDQWEVFGVDASVYQGEVDWPALADQGVDFAFLKATEGSSLQDVRFAQNWANAQAAGVRVGAYHFFSYDSPGETQADNFISAVPVTPGALPPVVDIEFYGDNLKNPPEADHVKAVLDPLLERLEAHYGVKPILYVTYRSYALYLKKGYEDYRFWFSSPAVMPFWRPWTFWQYSHSARLEGYTGGEERIDLNVFRGSRADFQALFGGG